MMEQVFEPETAVWRGLGEIPRSGMKIREEFAEFDASKRFSFAPENKEQSLGCRCGEILKGLMPPEECPLFGKVCTPADPVGPCMVSGEGACAAAYKYRSI